MALVKDSKWQPGDVIRVGFMDGGSALQQRVAAQAQEWLKYADLTMYFGSIHTADIRVSFTQDPGSWSYIGTQCKTITDSDATMNYGWLTDATPDDEVRRVVLHEF